MGPLNGLKILEMEAIGPVPFAAMLLADLGASVLRIERPGGTDVGLPRERHLDLTLRNRKIVTLNLKDTDEFEKIWPLVEKADVLLEGGRPGVMERLGLGPDECLARNPRLVYGRMTGWGQEGPLAQAAGHDMNYIALAGALHGIGRADQPPTPPLNLVGDYGGGSMYLVFGILSALYERSTSEKGQVVDAAIVDGTASLMTVFAGMYKQGLMTYERGKNVIDSGAHFYDVYQCLDGEWISLGPIEPKFQKLMLAALEIEYDDLDATYHRENWAGLKAQIAARIAEKTQAEWNEILEGTDCCYAPVLSLEDAARHPHNRARGTFIDVAGVMQPAPAPRFSRSSPDPIRPPVKQTPEKDEETIRNWLTG
ncbi:CaiB/BaiF CoA-transferase family protein [uncultured Sneathiella sp.]|jgi:crotonobetainyl-CoA:carnitine CoA-transferase CaiB-like acyl-CoA transferase|uniref:CaiB/BaiF CoA transferase family protein n=1 Tax=uncultured Sneathiella sp. TaxID=879315 RepID=UPI0030DA57F9|tara:strand:- start:12724 stop:13827 length:1104 start_codon:yes stop_codon:yes gene_type:complete